MCSIMAAAVGMMAFGAMNSAQGSKQQAQVAQNTARQEQAVQNYQAKVSDNNAQIAEWQAQDAIRQGHLEEQNLRLDSRMLRSAQRTKMAANGIMLDSDTAIDVLTSTDYLTERDASVIKDNARRNAWGYQLQKTNYQDQAEAQRYGADMSGHNAASISPSRAMTTSLLGSAARAAPALYGMYQGSAGAGAGGSGAGGSLNNAASGVRLYGIRR